MVFAFADCELDEKLYQLRRGGRSVAIEPKVFDVLRHLLVNRDRVVSKIELLDALWPGEAVSESVLPRCIAAARRAIGDDRTRQALIQTVHGRGYRFVGAVATPARAAAPPAAAAAASPALSPFVGREAAMRRLREALDQVLLARGRLVLLVGEPGIGKTRTADELAGEAHARGARVLAGRCYEGEGAPAYWPWVQVLRACTADLERATLAKDLGPGAADLAQLVPELREHFPDLPPEQALEGEQARFRLFDSVSRFLERASLREPLAIALDDLHVADADSLRLLRFLAGSLRNRRVLLLATYRDVDVRRDHPLAALLGALAREPHCDRVPLRGLAVAEVSALVEAIAGEPAGAELVGAIHELTEGNPFFVHEIVRLMVEQGRLASGDRRELSLALPQSVRDVVGRRLDALSPECNELLRAGAVIGREFSTGLLERVTGRGGDALLEPIGEALAAQVLVESRAGWSRYAFGHALTRHTLYEELSVPERVQLHRRVALALEAAADGSDDVLAELAHHFFQAAPGGDVEKAIAYSERAAEHAHGLFAYDESARHYERALEALALALPADERRRCGLLLALAEELWAAGLRERARARFTQAAEIARRLGDVPQLARAAVGLRGYGEMGVGPEPETLVLLEEALVAVGDGHAVSRSRVLSRLAGSAPHSRRMADRERLSAEAYALATESGDRLAISDAIAARYWAMLGPDRPAERLALGDEAVAKGEEWGDVRLQILGREARIGAHVLRGDMTGARREIETYAQLADELRQPLFRFLSSLLRGSFALDTGRFDEAARHFDEALGRGRGTVVYAELLHSGTVYWLHHMRGDELSFAEIEPMLDTLFPDEEATLRALIRLGIASVRISQGDAAGARREYDAVAAAGFRSLERDEHWLLAMNLLVDQSLTFADAEGAALLHELLSPYRDLAASHDLIRTVMRTVASLLGTLGTVTGDLDAGEAHFEHAIGRERGQGLLPALHDSQAGLARLLVARGRRGDLSRARALVEEAEAGARAIGSRRSFREILARAR
jgi:DNA-binding winged helix-turn-helix (wHTH) protein/tetratricopeptide (TPR) repeat protein